MTFTYKIQFLQQGSAIIYLLKNVEAVSGNNQGVLSHK